MPIPCRRPCRLALAGLLLLGAILPPSRAGEPPGRFLVISDFHFDPFDGLDAAQFRKLAGAALEDWPAILASQPRAAYGRDAPDSLVESSLVDASRQLAGPDFILCPGDFLAHSWQVKYDRLAARPRGQDPGAYRAFTANVLRYLAARVQRTFPTTPFLSVLGNDDSDCGDYMIEPASPFLSTFAEIWDSRLHAGLHTGSGTPNHAGFQAEFAPGGYYSIRLPRLRNHRLIALNSVYFSTQYQNACGSAAATPALDELRWLEEALVAAERAHERVWLLMHIPPGIDVYSTARAAGDARGFWQPELTAKFVQLIERFQSTIQLAIAGHTHMDDFRLLALEGKTLLLTKVVPAVSPIFGNNPGYQIFEYDRETGVVQNYETHFLPLNAADQPADSATGLKSWRLEYDYRGSFRQPRMDIEALARIVVELKPGSAMASMYARHYTVSGPPASVPFPVLKCAIGHVTVGQCKACLSAEPGR